MADADRTSTNPGENLRVLLRTYAPCLILIDEWVAYARQLLGKEDLPAGTFDTHFSFAQALTEAVRATPGAMLVVSLPASQRGEADGSDADRDLGGSEREVGGTGGREALRRLRNVVGRMESSWRPATAEESFAIVQRRLFQPIDPQKLALRDATAREFADLYRTQGPEFPSECRKPDYEAKIRAAYPIHPELFERLYEDWSTLDRFQRTRGVLRLMATVIHVLWHAGDHSPLILPASIPLDDTATQTELTRHLDDNWKPIIDTDVDGPGSMSRALDEQYKNLGQYGAARRVARAVFFGSAPRAGRGGRGIDTARVRLGCAFPKQTISVYGDALARLADRATYLYGDDGTYWFGTQPGVTRMARDRAERLLSSERPVVHSAIVRKLVAATKPAGHFAEVHVAPDGPEGVTDTAEVRLVVLPPDVSHVPRSQDSGAWTMARAILSSDGSGTRDYPNMLVFLAPDQAVVPDLEQAVAQALAWAWIDDQAHELDLSVQQIAQAKTRREEAERASEVRLATAYRWLLVPAQPDPIGPIGFEVLRVDGAGGLAVRAANKLVAETKLFTVYPPVLLRALLDGVLAPEWTSGHVSVSRLWDLIATYAYLPRLASIHVLEDAARNAPNTATWAMDSFTCADAHDPSTGRYLGLSRGGIFATATASTLLVRPDVANEQLTRERVSTPPVRSDPDTGTADGTRDRPTAAPLPAPPPAPTRFVGSLVLDSANLARDFRRSVDEVITHLLALHGTTVEIRLDIHADRTEGFPSDVRQIVSENVKQLRYDDGSGFRE